MNYTYSVYLCLTTFRSAEALAMKPLLAGAGGGDQTQNKISKADNPTSDLEKDSLSSNDDESTRDTDRDKGSMLGVDNPDPETAYDEEVILSK